MKQVRAVVIGCGDMGRNHAREWKSAPDCSVVAVFDPDTQRAIALGTEMGAQVAASWQEAVARADADVVSVCTPVCDHAPVALAAIAAGKHVLVEKPIALTVADARAMIEAAAGRGVHLGVSYQYRGTAKYRKVRELIEKGAVAGPLFARFSDVREVRPKTAMHRRSMNGGPIVDMAGHYFDLMRYWTGREPESVYARGHVFGRGKQRLAAFDDLAVDAAEIVVTMEGGHVLSVFVNWGMPEGFPAIGHEAVTTPSASVWPEGESVVVQHADRKEIFAVGQSTFTPKPRILDMLGAIRGERALEVRGEDGLAALRVSLAALESAEKSAVVDMRS